VNAIHLHAHPGGSCTLLCNRLIRQNYLFVGSTRRFSELPWIVPSTPRIRVQLPYTTINRANRYTLKKFFRWKPRQAISKIRLWRGPRYLPRRTVIPDSSRR